MTNGDARRAVRSGGHHPLGRVPRPLRRAARPGDPARRARQTPRVRVRPRSHGGPLELPPDRFTDDDRLRRPRWRRYEAEPPVRVLFDNGAGGAAPGAPVASVRSLVRRVAARRDAEPTRSYLGADGTPGATPHRHGRRCRLATATTPPRCRRPTTRPRTTTSSTRCRPTTGSRSPDGHGARVRDAAAAATTSSCSARRASTSGCARRAATPTSRSRSPRCGPTARRPTCRAAGCARATASSTAETSTPLAPVPTHRRATPRDLPAGTVLARPGADLPLRARLPRRVAHPRHRAATRRQPRRGGRSTRLAADGRGHGRDRPHAAHPSGVVAVGRAGRRGDDPAATVPGAARPAVPPYVPSSTGG